MAKRKKTATGLIFKVLFGLSVLILLFIAGFTYRQTLALTSSAHWVAHTYEVNNELEQLFSYLKDAENEQRGFIISHDSAFIKPYTRAIESTNLSFMAVKAMTQDNATQQKNLDSLHILLNSRFLYMANTLRVSGRRSPAALDTALAGGQDAMNAVRILINKMHRSETALLEERKAEHTADLSVEPVITLFAMLFSLVIFILSYIKINEDSKRLGWFNGELMVTNEAFENAEAIAGLGHWQWNLQTKKFTCSDNQFSLMGIQPMAEPSYDAFLNMIHPADKEAVAAMGRRIIATGEASSVFFRVMLPGGNMRYFKAEGKLLSDIHGCQILLGVVMDITQQHISSIDLERKNKELEKNNAELESFNYLASHDLQEPLRKIQTFISRISEKEGGKFSETAKDYFSRMRLSAERMQKLINYLLMYSRTNRGDQVLEQTDLGMVAEHAKQELSLLIEETKAQITMGPLPVISAIPAQMQQMFINIIGNALKYRRPDEPPRISILCAMVEVPEGENDMGFARKFYKISISDNGMGFGQESAENIFQLFRRLDTHPSVAGSGIGLAICKKIAENHHGYITAEGNPGQGAVFNIFLPADTEA